MTRRHSSASCEPRYSKALKDRAKWLISELGGLEQAQLMERIVNQIGRWAVEFQDEVGQPGRRE